MSPVRDLVLAQSLNRKRTFARIFSTGASKQQVFETQNESRTPSESCDMKEPKGRGAIVYPDHFVKDRQILAGKKRNLYLISHGNGYNTRSGQI